ncbi:beta-lactamase class A [Pelomonas saccharophila]|uniref:beta-lactamase n=1 Tax=Roseateles saccharophilus TaxID=304 RepID=A0ABU1YMW4_ROSSA|nr:serine hydrolase [Roseateles saccharophilus]MDR7270190.1 beta-lactamase class A [Roseateles saccharophilus]
MNNDDLAQALLAAVRAQRFEQTADSLRGGEPVDAPPSIDLAVAVFPRGGAAPVCANVLFSREHPRGLVARFDAATGAVANIAFQADVRDAKGDSHAWLPGADWSRIDFPAWFGQGPRFVAPYPASLLKMMVAVGVGRLVDAGRSDWALPLVYQDQTRAVADWLFDMITVSSNEATSALVAHLHERGAIRREGGREVHNEMHDAFKAAGLPGLMIANTQADGGWGNGAGSGVGQIQMTAWDALRLMWRLDADAPATPELVSPASRDVIRRALDAQKLHHNLSSESLRALPGWVPGIPARFAHKTGNTQNYTSDAGIVHDGELHYLIALTTSLGMRYAPHPEASTTWKVPALGAAIHAWLKANS